MNKIKPGKQKTNSKVIAKDKHNSIKSLTLEYLLTFK